MKSFLILIIMSLVGFGSYFFFQKPESAKTSPVTQTEKEIMAKQVAHFMSANEKVIVEKLKNPDAQVKAKPATEDDHYYDELSRYFYRSDKDESLKEILVARKSKLMSDEEVLSRVDKYNQVLLTDPLHSIDVIEKSMGSLSRDADFEREVLNDSYYMALFEIESRESEPAKKGEIILNAGKVEERHDVIADYYPELFGI